MSLRLGLVHAPENGTAQAAAAQGSGFQLGHLPALDGLRGVAILSVLAIHVYPRLLEGGHFGVDIFFSLSGFLITALLLQEWGRTGRINLKAFYLRRALRLLPALVSMLAIGGLYTYFFRGPKPAHQWGKDSLAVLLYYFNWKMAYTPLTWLTPSLLQCWSLAVEEQFYLVWPIVLVVLLRFGARRGWTVALVVLGIAASAGLLMRLTPSQGLYVRTDTRAVGLLTGCLVAALAYWDLLPRARWSRAILQASALLAVGVLAYHLAAAHLHPWYKIHLASTVVALAVGVILAALLRSPLRVFRWLLDWSLLRWFGRISYGLYLWNAPIIVALTPYYLISTHTWWWLAAQVAAPVAAACLSFYLLEKPFLRLKDRLAPASPIRPPVQEGPAGRVDAQAA
jgi:peptidoglycan/LPS O-acetylase OafA/YrhL